ncbi:MAG TPA: response regulator transcription factor [Rubrobacter sp.]|nr:response regulator transcription factor [Rubrobacter sp.]
MGLEKALGPVCLHKGQDAPAGESPSAVICYPSDEESLAAEVESALIVAPNAVVLVFLASSPTLALARAALGAGANGLLHDGMRPEQFLRSIHVALQGETVLPRCLLSEWVDEQRPPDLGALLSGRQRQILELVAEGFTNAEIAGHLYLVESTVKQHLSAAYKALGVRDRREAAALSRRFRSKYT